MLSLSTEPVLFLRVLIIIIFSLFINEILIAAFDFSHLPFSSMSLIVDPLFLWGILIRICFIFCTYAYIKIIGLIARRETPEEKKERKRERDRRQRQQDEQDEEEDRQQQERDEERARQRERDRAHDAEWDLRQRQWEREKREWERECREWEKDRQKRERDREQK